VVEAIAGASHPVLATTRMLSVATREAHKGLPGPILASLDRQQEGMISDAEGCYRIVSTPMPFAYIVHLRWAAGGGCSWGQGLMD
jgi:predicted membrane chloride channel (bestrophin family)